MANTFHTYAGPSFEKLARKMAADGEPLPGNPILCVGFGAENEAGDIVAYIVVQSIPLVEPAKAEPGSGEAMAELFNMAREFIMDSKAPRVIMHSEHAAMKRMIHRTKAKVFPGEFFDWRRDG